MTADHNLRVSRMGMGFQILEVVQHEDRHAAQRQALCLRQGHRPFASVVIAPHRRDRGYFGEFAENALVSNVTRMNDVIASAQEAFGFWPKQAVGVRNQADAQHPCSLPTAIPDER